MMIDLPDKTSIEMGFSRLEFNTLLHAQTAMSFTADGDEVVFFYAGGEIKVCLGEDDFRRIASWKIPKMKVDLDFTNLAEASRRPFMKVLLKTFLKGGG